MALKLKPASIQKKIATQMAGKVKGKSAATIVELNTLTSPHPYKVPVKRKMVDNVSVEWKVETPSSTNPTLGTHV